MLGPAPVPSGFGKVNRSRYGIRDGRGGELGVMWLVKGVGRVCLGLEANRQ
jgi:hypothetical protein